VFWGDGKAVLASFVLEVAKNGVGKEQGWSR